MSLWRGLQAIVQVVRRRVQQQAHQHAVQSARQRPDGTSANTAPLIRPLRAPEHALNVSRSGRNLATGYVTQPSLASRASRLWSSTPRFVQANGGRAVPLVLGFAGFGFVRHGPEFEEDGGDTGNGLRGRNLDLETATRLIRAVFRDGENKPRQARNAQPDTAFPEQIDSYVFSEHILAKGTEGVVYAAKRREIVPEAVGHDDGGAGFAGAGTDGVARLEMNGNQCQEEEQQTGDLPLCNENECNLAVKLMFNYDTESTAAIIMADFHAEQLPLLVACGKFGNTNRQSRLSSSHPNIVEMHQVFVDDVKVPNYKDALDKFDMALPRRLNILGAGADTTMYIVMKRYQTSLRNYLDESGPLSGRVSMVIVAQLLEAVGHLGEIGVFHRDLKSNNILVDFHQCGESPRVVIADFGCAVSLDGRSLSDDVSVEDRRRQGNLALMAPEVKRAYKQTVMCYHDYLKADAWAVGAITFEVCGQKNPFYYGHDSGTYDQQNLPQLQTQSVGLKVVTSLLLQSEPSDRLAPEVAADILHLCLWHPPGESLIRLQRGQSSRDTELVSWLNKVSVTHVLNNGLSLQAWGFRGITRTDAEQGLLSAFLKRVKAPSLGEAADHAGAAISGILAPEPRIDRLCPWEETTWKSAVQSQTLPCLA